MVYNRDKNLIKMYCLEIFSAFFFLLVPLTPFSYRRVNQIARPHVQCTKSVPSLCHVNREKFAFHAIRAQLQRDGAESEGGGGGGDESN